MKRLCKECKYPMIETVIGCSLHYKKTEVVQMFKEKLQIIEDNIKYTQNIINTTPKDEDIDIWELRGKKAGLEKALQILTSEAISPFDIPY